MATVAPQKDISPQERTLMAHVIGKEWSSLVGGGEGSNLPNCQTTLVIALDALSLLFCIFINTTLGQIRPFTSFY